MNLSTQSIRYAPNKPTQDKKVDREMAEKTLLSSLPSRLDRLSECASRARSRTDNRAAELITDTSAYQTVNRYNKPIPTPTLADYPSS